MNYLQTTSVVLAVAEGLSFNKQNALLHLSSITVFILRYKNSCITNLNL